MYALPPHLEEAAEPRLTGVGCPVCAGVLSVQREGGTGHRARAQIGGPHDERIAQAHVHVTRLRAILAEKRPVDLTPAPDADG